jgi:transglutaminase-like putative cysteine protease
LLFVVPTMVVSIPIWIPAIFLAALLVKFWLEQRGRRLRSTGWKIVLAVVGFGAVLATYGSPIGLEPGVSILVLLASLKILESHTARDFHVLVMIGWVLCLCALLMSQDLAVALCVLAAFVLLVAALVEFHRRSAAGARRAAPLGIALKLLVQALPLIIVFFFLFPRASVGLRLRVLASGSDSVGFSGELSPGSVAAVAGSDDIAFRVEFPDGHMPARNEMYWRGAVLWQGDGLNWEVGPGIGNGQPAKRTHAGAVRQWITVEPHSGRWLFALDRPLDAPPGSHLVPGRYISSFRPVSSVRRYEVTSASDGGEDNLHPRERAAALRPPSVVGPQMNALVASWTAADNDPRALVNAALEFFRTNAFVYSMAPGPYAGPDALDELLFRRRTGFCEHYAAAFATLMRVAGVPARVVVGYLGGEFNRYGNYLLVRQSDAHAWCEVWLPDSGWTRVDPTSVIAPERVDVGSLRQMSTQSIQSQSNTRERLTTAPSTAAGGALANVRLAWDTVTYTWDSRVLSFDDEGQREFFADHGLADLPNVSYLLALVGFAAIWLAVFACWYRWRTRAERDPAKAWYERFCRKAAQLGATRTPTEGPVDFARRAGLLLPHHASRIQQIAQQYVALRYANEAGAERIRSFAAAVQAFARAK